MAWFKKKSPQEKRRATIKANMRAKKRAQNRKTLKKWVQQGRETVQQVQKYSDDSRRAETTRLKEKTARLKAKTEYERARQSYDQARGGSYGGSASYGSYSSASAPSTFVWGQGFQEPRTAPAPQKKRRTTKRRKKK